MAQSNQNNTIFKNDSPTDLIEIYRIQVERISKHYDLRLQHFTIYFGFNSGLFIILGLVLQPFISLPETPMSEDVKMILTAGTIIGFLFSFLWLLATRTDREFQLILNKIISDTEKALFKNKKYGIYLQTNEWYSPDKKTGFDIIDLNSYVSVLFIIIWLFILYFVYCVL